MSRSIHVGLLFTYSFSFYRDVLRGIRQFAEARPDWTFLPLFVERRRLCWQGSARPDGVLATINSPPFAQAVKSWRRPLVNVSATLRDLPYPRVAVDNRVVGRLAAEHFLERGLRQFAFVGQPRHLACEERQESFCDVIRAAGFKVACYFTPRDRPFDPQGTEWYLDRRVERWLLSLPKPVGIFVSGDILGAALTQICREVELRVPDDVALLGVDNDDLYCHLAKPPLSSVMVNAHRIGFEAAALLDRLMAGEKPPAGPILVAPGNVCVRHSSDLLAIEDRAVALAARFIREHYHLPTTVTDVLQAVSISRRSLERRFQQALGRGLAEEIRRVRLQRSKHLLAETDLHMPAVAKHSGFSSARHLASAFRRETGESLTQYRRKMRVRGGVE